MFKLGGTSPDTMTTTTSNLKMKKPDQQPLLERNNLKNTTKKEYVNNAVKTAFDMPPHQHQTSSKADDYLDRHLMSKADLDYIPGLDDHLGPVFIPSRNIIFTKKRLNFIFSFSLASFDKLPGLDDPAAAKARAEEAARKREAEIAAEAEAKKKENTRVVKPILPHSSMFIFSSTNP
jgi:hypothetical protein